MEACTGCCYFFSSRRRHTRWTGDWSSDVCSSDLDGGTTWEKRPAPGRRDWAPEDTAGIVPRWVEPLAWDGQGRLYSLWTDTAGVWLARSADQAETWTSWRVVASRDM